ncbi:MAG: VOC family protein [Acidimicrobiia bacterium]
MSAGEMRVVVEVEDVAEALKLYRDVLGLTQVASFREGEAEVVLLEARRGTIELSNREQTLMIDRIETGREIGSRFRIAFAVEDTRERTVAAESAGARLIGGPQLTPWGSLNSRLESADGLQLTLFQDHGEEEVWTGETAD